MGSWFGTFYRIPVYFKLGWFRKCDKSHNFILLSSSI